MRYKVEISILVPIYNVEKYLPRCIESVLTQDFQDWELVLVDDGSPDKCGEICDEYASKHPDKIKVVHTKNKGVASARLTSFQNASGEFLVFLDSDDWLLPNALSVLYNAITSENGIDIVRSIVKRVTDDGKEWIEHYDIESDVIGENSFFQSMKHDNISPYLHSGIYRSYLFKEEIFLPLIENSISVGDDWIINYYISPLVKHVKFIHTPVYAYFLNTSSMMGGSVYGWEYYRRIEKCMNTVKAELGIYEPAAPNLHSVLNQLRFFFLPEVKFNWKQFERIQPLIKEGIKNKEIKRYRVNHKYLRFIKYKFPFYIYTLIYRYAFLFMRLKGKKRKLLK